MRRAARVCPDRGGQAASADREDAPVLVGPGLDSGRVHGSLLRRYVTGSRMPNGTGGSTSTDPVHPYGETAGQAIRSRTTGSGANDVPVGAMSYASGSALRA